MLSLDEVEEMNETMIEVLEAEETVTKIHEWIVTTVNGDILSVEDICAKELDIAEMTAQFNKVTGLIAIE